MDTHRPLARIALDDLGAVRIAGADAVRFLQGQLSNDVTRLAPEHSLLAGYHTPQGRALALLRLAWLAEGEVLAVLPRELAGTIAERLVKYVLRAKVTVADVSHEWCVNGLLADDSGAAPTAVNIAYADLPPPGTRAQRRRGRQLLLGTGDGSGRWLEIAPRADAPAPDPAARARWRLLDVRAGMPQVYAATSAQFVAQMLNLDVLGAIAFDKGCYTGQEVIARAHYRGRVKRRAQRFRSTVPLELAAGASGRLPDGRSVAIVEAAQLPDGRCEFLAVAALAHEPPEGAADEAAPGLPAEPLALPYALPA
jgi:folate-binding protein YgfZ